MNLNLLQESSFPLSSYNGFTRYEISEKDQQDFCLKMTEWFCDSCGEMTDEDHLDFCEKYEIPEMNEEARSIKNTFVNHFSNLQEIPYLEDKLNYVGNQIGIHDVDIDHILTAYLNLRQENKELRKHESEQWNETIKAAKEYFEKTQEDYFISYDRLRNMTLSEIAKELS